MNEIAVRCENLKKTFQTNSAVHNASVSVQKGEIMALLGPSGCGKTTTLRMIAGFERPDAGRIYVGERLVAGPGCFVPPEQRQVGMVFQNYALFPHMSVSDNVAYGLSRKVDRRACVAETLSLVGLSGTEKRMPHELSGGQQQRVALARALAPKPRVLLLDEPFSGLDEGLRDQLRGDVLQILRQSGATVILVTHNQEEALFLGDRVAVMHDGVVEQVAAPEQLYAQPASRFVAEFMGSAFFLHGVARPNGLETELGFLAQAVNVASGTPIEAATRPDDLTLIADPAGPARILNTIYRGGSYLYEVQLPSGNVVRCEGPHTVRHAAGEAVRIELTPGHGLAHFVRPL
ncbi:MAG: ABC transporter ATP-binding protein [Caldilineaceae bacterium]|nr:ABC transporter ATP-binding protein [Caldilineaceae bacterium]MCB0139150.1 ABC transporter ATP-binding protein [Caldilineaceae bacterium]